MAAARAHNPNPNPNRGISGRSHPASRRDSGLSAGAGRAPGGGGAGGGNSGAGPSPLRCSLSVATSLALEDAAAVGGAGCGGAASPRALDMARQTLFDRFGSFEGLSAALDDFYHRLCSDDRVGARIKQVPEPDVWLTMTQLMALSLQQQDHEDAVHTSRGHQDRQLWMRRCQALLRGSSSGDGATAAAAAAAAEEGDMDEQDAVAVYDAVMGNLLATLERLGALGTGGASRGVDGDGGDGGTTDDLSLEVNIEPAMLYDDVAAAAPTLMTAC